MPDRPIEVYEFGEFRLDVGERTLERRGGRERIAMPEKAFQTLVHLVRNRGALVTKDAILSTVWPDVFIEDGNIGKVIHTIRRVLGDRSGECAYIETVPKHGYRFTADVSRIGETAAEASSAPPARAVAFRGRSPAYDLYIRGKVKADSENVGQRDDT